jgi:hypothetical protein
VELREGAVRLIRALEGDDDEFRHGALLVKAARAPP